MNRFESFTTQPLTWFMALLLAAFVAGCGDGNGAAVVSSKPTVSSTVPLNLATGVALNSNITATFSEAMQSSTITTTTFTLKQGSTPVLGVVTYAGVIATFNPTSNLAISTNYTATVTTGAKDLAGNTLAATRTWSFTTGTTTDTAAPTVNSTLPVSAGTGAINANITATFSEPMDIATITDVTFTLKQGTTPVSGVVGYASNIATFNPAADLTASTSYTATISTAVTDLAGNAMVANYTWDFTTSATADTTAPTVSLTSPLNGASGVAVSSNITATFDEAMNTATLTTATFTLETASASAVSGTVTPTTTTATFNPDSDLAASAVYTAKITTGATDSSGNPLVPKTWSFTTAGGGAGTLTLTANAPIITEPAAAGTKAMTFVLTLNPAPAAAVTVNYATQVSGSATSGADFVAATGTVNFATGQTVATVPIVVNGDAAAEPDETVHVLFSGADLVASVTGTGTILANDTTGIVVALTAGGTDTTANLGLTANDDSVSGTINQGTIAGGSLQGGDIFNGGAGTDTLTLTPVVDVALILSDNLFTGLFAGVTGFDRIVINTTGLGAQTITGTNANIYAAFGTAGVDLDTTSSTGAMTIDTSPFAGPTTLKITTTASVAGNFITTGSGVTTVIATTTTGPVTINSASAVVATVTLTSGDSPPGNAITTGTGNDTITIVASGAAASTNGNLITGGLGADTITLAVDASIDNIVIANGDTGITVATADSITNFTAGQDFLKMGLAGDAANYAEAGVADTDFAAALTAANLALDTTVLHSFRFVGAGATLVGYLFKDTNGDGTADEVVVLVGVDNNGIAAANIIL